MGWRGDLRSFNAAINRSIRESDRRQRTRNRRAREQAKAEAEHIRFQQQAHDQNTTKNTVAAYERKLIEIVSYHHRCNGDMDWHYIREERSPTEPSPVKSRSSVIQKKIDDFKPLFFDNIINTKKWRFKRLQAKLQVALEQDGKEYQFRLSQFRKDAENWQSRQVMAARLFSGDSAAFIEAIKTHEFFIDDLPCDDIHFNIDQHKNLIIEIAIASIDEIVPFEEHSLTKTGKLSSKSMAKTKRTELYQDHIASLILRAVREAFALVPVSHILAHAYIKAINPQTGHKEDQLILSARINKTMMDRLNFKDVDPSDALRNFPHNMSFSRTKGFSVVSPIKPA